MTSNRIVHTRKMGDVGQVREDVDESEQAFLPFQWASLLGLVTVIVASPGVSLVFMQKCLRMHTVTRLLRCTAVTRIWLCAILLIPRYFLNSSAISSRSWAIMSRLFVQFPNMWGFTAFCLVSGLNPGSVAAAVDGLASNVSIHIKEHTVTCQSRSRDSDVLCWSHVMRVYPLRHTQTHVK